MILQSVGSTLVLIDCTVNHKENTIAAKLTYAESGLVSPVEVRSLVTGESYSLLIDDELASLGTYGVDSSERLFELA